MVLVIPSPRARRLDTEVRLSALRVVASCYPSALRPARAGPFCPVPAAGALPNGKSEWPPTPSHPFGHGILKLIRHQARSKNSLIIWGNQSSAARARPISTTITPRMCPPPSADGCSDPDDSVSWFDGTAAGKVAISTFSLPLHTRCARHVFPATLCYRTPGALLVEIPMG